MLNVNGAKYKNKEPPQIGKALEWLSGFQQIHYLKQNDAVNMHVVNPHRSLVFIKMHYSRN